MPNPWPLVPLGTILRRAQRFELRDDAQEYQFAGTYSFGRGIFLSEHKLGAAFGLPKIQRIHEGDFVYCKIMAWEGAFGLVPAQAHNSVMSGAFVAYEIDRSQLDPRFISYYFKITSVWKSIGSQSTGTNIRRRSLHPDQFEAAKIPLPPLDEQRRIVARIGQLAAKIQEARSLRHEAAEQGEAVVRTTARKLLGQVDAPLTPLASWVDTSCDAIQTGPFGAQLSSSDFVESGLPLLTIGNVQFGGLDRAGLKYVTKEKAKQLSRYRVIEGDILLARMGTVGRCCIVPADADGWLINYHIIRVRLDRARVDPPYIHWIIQASGDVESYLEEKIRGATRQGVNSSIVGNIPCRVALLPEQRRIVAYLDDLQAKADGLKKLQAETAAELDSLLPSILDEAFKGEL